MTDYTIKGASGNIVTLQGLPPINEALLHDMVLGYQSKINAAINNNSVKAVSLPNKEDETATTLPLAGIIDQPTNAIINKQYKYVVIAKDTDLSATQPNVSIQAVDTTPNDNITILAGRKSGFSYTAGNESGTIINTTANLNFNAAGKTGNWNITSWDTSTNNGNVNIHTGKGNNYITVATGKASIYSEGHDDISVNGPTTSDPSYPYTHAEVTLAGGNSTVFAGKGSFVTDISSNNKISANENTTIQAGTSGSITFSTITDHPGNNTIQGGSDNIINSEGTNVTAIHGANNTFTKVTENLTFFNGDGNTNATISKQFIGFGANDLNFTLNYDSFGNTKDKPFTGSSLFVADKGNETLNASGYNNKIEIYANTVTGAQTNFVAKGGAGDDVLAAGTGNSTFTGGAGNNLFMFTKEVINNGTTIITDFANKGSNNHIGLYDYGFNTDSIAQLLSVSKNDDKGNAVLNLENHKITIEGVSVADLKTSQFVS